MRLQRKRLTILTVKHLNGGAETVHVNAVLINDETVTYARREPSKLNSDLLAGDNAPIKLAV